MFKTQSIDGQAGASVQRLLLSVSGHHPGSRAKLPGYLAAALVLAGLCQPAHANLPLFEDFDDNAALYTTVLGGDATASAINIRPASNAINTGVNTGFDSFFGSDPNRFLVIGDNVGGFGGEPDGQPYGALSLVKFDLGQLGAGQQSLGISFDYAFDTNLNPGTTDARSPDDFYVWLLDGSGDLINEMLRFDDVQRNEVSRRGHFNQTVNFTLPSMSNVYLSFGLFEYNDTSSSAVGLDNIHVMAVPETETYALILAGLGLIAMRCRRNRHVVI